MITRGTKLKIGAFVLVALLGVSYVSASYVGLFRSSSTVVTMQLADSGGIFTNAEVTYRGVTIGRVGQLRLTSDGIEATFAQNESHLPSRRRYVSTFER